MLKYQLFKTSRLKFERLAFGPAKVLRRNRPLVIVTSFNSMHLTLPEESNDSAFDNEKQFVLKGIDAILCAYLYSSLSLTYIPPLPFFFYCSLGPRSLWYYHFKMAYRHVVKKPQLQARIFLCNWYMKIVRPGREIPENTVQFHVPME